MLRNKCRAASVGIVLAIIGISAMAMVKGLLNANLQILSSGVAVLSVILLFLGQNPRYFRVLPKSVGLIFIYSIVTLLLCLFSSTPLMTSGRGFFSQLLYFLQILFLWNARIEDDNDLYVRFGFWFTGVFCLIALYLLLQTGNGSIFFNNYVSDSGEYLFNRSSTGALSHVTFALALAYRPKGKKGRLAKWIFLAAAVLVLIATVKRAPYVAAIGSLCLHIKNRHEGRIANKNRILKTFLIVFVLGAVLYVAACTSAEVMYTLEHAYKMLVNGFNTILGIDQSDMSASMRVDSASDAIHTYLHDSNLVQFLFGRGYMAKWIDMPFLEAFFDLGVFGGITFCIIMFLIPFKHLMKKAHSQALMAAQYIAVLPIVDGLINSYPYGNFFTIVLLLKISYSEDIHLGAKGNLP